MTRLKLLPTLVATLLLGLGACAPESDNAPEEPTLSLSSTAVTIPNAGGSAEAIAVTTNQSKWNAISNAAWVTTGVSGNSLTITAAPNPDGADRSAEVLVVAGATSAKISVIQTAADIVLEVSPDSIVVSNAGATKLVSVRSNSGTWTLEVDEAAAAWITKTVFEDFIQLEIAPNEGEAREAKLYAASGTTQREIVITQAGTSLTPFFFPTLKLELGDYELISYEEEQNGSYLTSYTPANPGLPDWGIPAEGAYYTFASSSALFPLLSYYFDYYLTTLASVQYVSPKGIEEIVESGYVDFLKEQGVADAAYDESKKLITGTHKESGFSVVATESEEGFCVVVFTAPAPKQPEAYPTFEEFPYDNTFMLGDLEYTAPRVKEVETEAKSKLVDEAMEESDSTLVKTQTYEVDSTLAPLHTRLYFFDNKKPEDGGEAPKNVSELLVVWSEPTLGAWEVTAGTFYLTKEFLALMEKEGFEFFMNSNNMDFYYNAEKKLMIVPRGARYSDVLVGQPVFSMNYFLYEEDQASLRDREATVKALAARIAEHDKALGAL